MCGRVRLSTDYSETKIKLKFDALSPAPNVPASWNVCPTDPVLVAPPSTVRKKLKPMRGFGRAKLLGFFVPASHLAASAITPLKPNLASMIGS
jgi:hypothetical protein